jgi:hypothetical protein
MFHREQSTEELQKYYPAIFAESAHEKTSDRYLYIPTHKLLDGLYKNGFKVVGAKQVKSRTSHEHGKHVVYLAPNFDFSMREVGQEYPMLALTNSHNASSAFAIDTAFFRLACSNGLMMPTQSYSSARITHKIGMERDVIEASYKVIESFPKMIKQVEAMKATELNNDEKRVLAESAQNLTFDYDQIELNKKLGVDIPTRLLNARRYDDKKSDLWTTFNVIQENIIKGGVRLVSESESGQRAIRRTRAVNSIDRDQKLNKELMSLAQKMLELKTGVAV